MKNIEIKIFIQNKRLEELSHDVKEKVKENIMETYKKQIKRKVISMIKENKSKEEIMKYLGMK
ncbi:hypothetical protein [Inediibacterium massiliense]|uniref:hypothetical protein n=1 Tax=Inediibacterium massiliense TaxID=1658111 RepID=UPI0006B453B4|nr:hypothetical protein [Inediibacterium massiliense]